MQLKKNRFFKPSNVVSPLNTKMSMCCIFEVKSLGNISVQVHQLLMLKHKYYIIKYSHFFKYDIKLRKYIKLQLLSPVATVAGRTTVKIYGGGSKRRVPPFLWVLINNFTHSSLRSRFTTDPCIIRPHFKRLFYDEFILFS